MADTLYFNDDGIKNMLNDTLNGAGKTLGGATCRLNQSSTAVTKATVIGGVTQATFSGYAAVALTAANWPTPTVSSNIASSLYNTTITFTHNSGATANTIYGGYTTDGANSLLYTSWNFASGPYTLSNNGDAISVQPTYTNVSLN